MLYVGTDRCMVHCGSNRYNIVEPLPGSYIQVGWIASANGGYINTGVKPKAGYSCEVVAKYYKHSDNAYQGMFGCRSGTASAFGVRDDNNNTAFSYQYSTNSGVTRTWMQYSIHRFRRHQWILYGLCHGETMADGTMKKYANGPTGTTTFPYNIYLFAECVTGNKEDQGYFYFKSAKIWDENNYIIRDYVPAYEISTQKYGMYDRVNRLFYGSSNSTEFIGDSLMVYPNPDSLPSGYTQVDYIRFTAQQYIYFNEVVAYTDCFEVEYRWTTQSGSAAYAPVQQRVFATSDNRSFVHYINGSGLMAFNYGQAASWVSTGKRANWSHWKTIFDGKNKTISMVGYDSYSASLSSYTPVESVTGFYLGASYNGASKSNIDIFRFKKYEDEVLVHDLVPCKNSSNVYGFYDKVQQEFLASYTETAFQGGYIRD